MNDPLWKIQISHFCANCHLYFDSNAQKMTRLDTVDDNANSGEILASSPVSNNIPILDALLYVYGLSYEDFAQIFLEDVNKTIKYFRDIGGEELSLCCKCLSVFKDVYRVHVQFDNLSKEDALLQKVIGFKSKKAMLVKKEPDEDFVNSLDFNHQDLVLDLEQNEIKTEFAQLREDNINIECVPLLPSFRTIEQQKGLSERVAQKEQMSAKVPKCASQSKTVIKPSATLSNDDGTLQPYIRLTRSKIKVTSALCQKSQDKSSEEEDASNSLSSSDYEVEVHKNPIKLKKTLKNTRSKKILPVETEMAIKPEISDGGNEFSEFEDEEGFESKVNEEFVKTRSADGKALVYTCNICGKVTSRIKDFTVHMNGHKKEVNREKRMRRRNVVCPVCGKLCRNADCFEIHKSKYHSEEPRVCDVCGKAFLRLESFLLHQKYSHSEAKPFECKTCGVKYKWKASLTSHQLTHKIARPHICEKCGVSYTNKSNLNQHYTYHEDEERDKELFRCKECNKLLKNRKSLRSHFIRYHREDSKMYSCHICGMSTKRKENLTAHMKIHDPDRVLKRRPKVYKKYQIPPTETETTIQPQCNPHALPPSFE